MSSSDRVATLFYVAVLLLLLAVGGMEYIQYNHRTEIANVGRKEQELKTKVDSLRKREQVAANLKPMIAQYDAQLVKAEKGNYYAQLLLDSVANQRLSGAQFPQYSFSTAGAAGKFPRFSITGSVSGTETQVLDFIRRFEEGTYKVQVPNINYAISGGQATASLTLIYTAEPEQDPAKK